MLVSIQFWSFCVLHLVIVHLLSDYIPYLFVRVAIVLLCPLLFKTRYFYKQVPIHKRCDGRTVAVIGASTGIGRALSGLLTCRERVDCTYFQHPTKTAPQFFLGLVHWHCDKIWCTGGPLKQGETGTASQKISLHIHNGATVMRAARSVDKLKQQLEDDGGSGLAMHIDLADLGAIRRFATQLKAQVQRLDCLVLNAAYHGAKATTKDGFEYTLGVNHLGHMYLVHELLDLLLRSGPSQIIVVASDLHRLCGGVRLNDLMFDQPGSYTMMGFTAYNHSKLCNVMFGKELANRLRGTGVTVNIVHPGTPVQSELVRSNILFGNWLMHDYVLPIIYFLWCRQAEDGAQTLLHCVVDKHAQTNTGLYYENLTIVSPSSLAEDPKISNELWYKSCELLKLDADWGTAARKTACG